MAKASSKQSLEREGIEKLVASNRRATHDYTIEERFEAGLQLMGSEVKSLRDGRLTLGEGHVLEDGDELWLADVHIPEYPYAGRRNHDPVRRRKLLLHRHEIDRIVERMTQRGLTCIPVRLYFKAGRAKVEIGLAKGKKLVDKRESLKAKSAKRDMDRASGRRR